MSERAANPRSSLFKLAVLGVFAGFLAGVAMLALMAALRLFFGVATPTEAIFDRLFPFLTVDFFIGSLVRAGGYSPLKLQGVFGALAGQLGTAAFGGVVYALFLGRLARPRPTHAPSRLLDPRGWRLIVPGVLAVWAVIVALLWPQLLTNYRGHPPVMATALTLLGMLASFGSCGVGIMFFYGLLTVPPSTRPAGGEPIAAGLTRRRFLAGGLGALLAVTLGNLLRRLYQIGTFNYNGTQYGGPGVQKITPNDQFYQVPTAPAEEVRVFVRAVNARGERQIEEFRDQVPHGALGLHWVRGRVLAVDGAEPKKVAVVDTPAANRRAAFCHRGVWNA